MGLQERTCPCAEHELCGRAGGRSHSEPATGGVFGAPVGSGRNATSGRSVPAPPESRDRRAAGSDTVGDQKAKSRIAPAILLLVHLTRSDHLGVTWIRAPGLASSACKKKPSAIWSEARILFPTTSTDRE